MRESQHLFLQTFMSKQFLTDKETIDIYNKACTAFGGTKTLSRQTH